MARLAFAALFLLLALALSADMGDAAPKYSCMVRWLRRSGVESNDLAIAYEKKLIKAGISAEVISKSPAIILKFLLGNELSEANAIRKCFAGKSKMCQSYSPCMNGGQCIFNLDGDANVCKCHVDYMGSFCEKAHPAPIREFKTLAKKVAGMQKRLHSVESEALLKVKTVKAVKKLQHDVKSVSKTLAPSSTCIASLLPHRTWTWRSSTSYSGNIRTVYFHKRRTTTALRVTFHTDLHLYHAGHGTRMYIRFDGSDCSSPSKKIDIYLQKSNTGSDYKVVTMHGLCSHAGGTRIGKGKHRINIYITSSDGSVNTNQQALSLLRVQEVCLPGM